MFLPIPIVQKSAGSMGLPPMPAVAIRRWSHQQRQWLRRCRWGRSQSLGTETYPGGPSLENFTTKVAWLDGGFLVETTNQNQKKMNKLMFTWELCMHGNQHINSFFPTNHVVGLMSVPSICSGVQLYSTCSNEDNPGSWISIQAVGFIGWCTWMFFWFISKES